MGGDQKVDLFSLDDPQKVQGRGITEFRITVLTECESVIWYFSS